MKYHPAANIFPLMPEPELQDLSEHIKEHGQLEAIKVIDGEFIIDGRNRWAACLLAGVEPKVEVVAAADPDELVSMVWGWNAKRRQLTKSQRDAAGVMMIEFIDAAKKEAKAKQKSDGKKGGSLGGRPTANKPLVSGDTKGSKKRDDSKRTNAKVAKKAKSSPAAISRAAAVQKNAPELFEEMKDGKTTTNSAYNQMKKREKLKELDEKAEAAKKQMKDDTPQWTLICDEVADGLQTVVDHHDFARLIFTDPPYNIGVDYGPGEAADSLSSQEYMNWVCDWLYLCHRCLSDDGSLWVMIGDEYAAEYAIALKEVGFTIRNWIKWYETFGVNQSNKFNRTSRHIFYCVVDENNFVFNQVPAIMRKSARQEKYNDQRAAAGGKIWDDVWQIPRLTGTAKERIPSFPTQLPLALVEPIIACASEPGDLILDPFNGSGTTGAAALKQGRKYIGIDRQEDFIDLAGKRLYAI